MTGATGAGLPAPSVGTTLFEDFLTANGANLGSTLWVGVSSGAGASANVGNFNVDGQHQGMLQLRTGSDAGPMGLGRASARHAGVAYSNVAAAGGSSSNEMLVARGDALAAPPHDYTLMCGWSSNVGGVGFGLDAALFVHDVTVSATNWVARTIVGGVPTSTDTGIAIAAINVFDKLRIDITLAAGAEFYVNGVLVVTPPPHPIGTMPNATSGFWAPIAKIEKLTTGAGTAERTFYVDYCAWSFVVSPPR